MGNPVKALKLATKEIVRLEHSEHEGGRYMMGLERQAKLIP